MGEAYEVIKAETREEALEKSKYKVGQLVEIYEILIVANPGEGTWSLFPRIRLTSNKENQ